MKKDELFIGFYQMVLKAKDGKMYERFTHHMPMPKVVEDAEMRLFHDLAEKEECEVVMLKKLITGIALPQMESVVLISPTQELREVGLLEVDNEVQDG